MKMSKKEYKQLVKSMAPKSPIWKDMLMAFVIGGAICALGQLILNGWKAAGLEKDAAGTAASITLVFLSAVLTALSLYDDIACHAGAGTLVPITGFANSVVSPALEFRHEGYILGTAAQMFSIAGPVIVYGTATSFLYGLIIYIFKLY